MGRVIAVANQKGGVGKTTTAINLSAALAEKNKKVLLIDIDPQGNATSGVGVEKNEVENTVYDLILGEASIQDCIEYTEFENLYLIPSNVDLAAAEIELIGIPDKEFIIRKEVEKIKDKYDFILIDCPPSLNLLTVNAMCAADSILVPLQCEYFALEGLTLLIDTVDQLAHAVNPKLKIEGILRTMFDNRNRLSSDVSDELKRNFDTLVYETIIPRNVRLAEAPSFGKPAMYYDKSSMGSKAYMALAHEMLQKDGK